MERKKRVLVASLRGLLQQSIAQISQLIEFTRLDTKPATAIGPYSHAVQTPFGVFVSGQLPADFEGNLVKGTMREKTEAVLKNLQEVLVTAKSSLDRIVKVQVFLTDMKDFAEMNEEYEKWITHKPARSCVAVKELPKGVNIEIECIALPLTSEPGE
ncbi:hypothetical protein BOTNAR_0025g00220 [Botryotinia narcissicola]|uniref:Uncharacterized protein n=1 Tax=Botryotinia narcissicola TaxID=278944 RepID=A0A4Z1J459_9HELO|nr:hypothetical protein BOTNAR_0025g00220 [Botryotinia narcissicola]